MVSQENVSNRDQNMMSEYDLNDSMIDDEYGFNQDDVSSIFNNILTEKIGERLVKNANNMISRIDEFEEDNSSSTTTPVKVIADAFEILKQYIPLEFS